MSIVEVIISLSAAESDMTEKQHTQALEYLSLQLALRDRKQIMEVLCNHKPDHLTEAIRGAVSAYDPMIRQVHQAVDLSATVGDLQVFMDAMIKLCKPSKSGTDGPKPPSVEDFIKLLHDHQGASHRFMHQVSKNGKEVTQWFNDYAHEVSKNFQTDSTSSTPSISDGLGKAYSALPEQDQKTVRAEIDAHASYLTAIHDSSAARIRAVLSTSSAQSSTPYGPGAYLARWQNLLDSTLITPATAHGPVRRGGSGSVKAESSKDVDGEVPEDAAGGLEASDKEKVVKDVTPEAPGTGETVRVLGSRFRELLRERS